MRLSKILTASALGAVLALGVPACSGGTNPSATTDVVGEPVTGGDLTVVLSKDAVRGLDPAFITNFTATGDANRMTAIFGVLFASDPSTGKVSPGLGKSIESNENGSIWTIILNDGVAFTDGTPFNAEAVKFNYDRIKDPAVKSPLAGQLAGVKVSAPDAVTVVLELDKPNRQFSGIVATALTHIASPKAVQTDPKFANNPVGAGPFMLDKWVLDDRMKLVRNPNYFEKGKPYLDSVTYLPIPDATQRLNAVVTGQAQAAVPPASENSYVESAKSQGLAVSAAQPGGGPLFTFNVTKAPFDDVRARKAIQLALNIDDLGSVVDPGSEAPRSLYSADSAFSPSESRFPKSDVGAAQELLDQLASEGKPLKFSITVPNAGFFAKAAQFAQSHLSQLSNIEVAVDLVDNATLEDRVFRKHDFQVSVQQMQLADPEPNLARQVGTGGSSNYGNYSNPKVDSLLEAGRSAGTESERKAAYDQLEDLLVEDVPMILLHGAMPYTVHSPKLQGVVLHGDGSMLYDDIWLSGAP